jgi:hypothetical protein
LAWPERHAELIDKAPQAVLDDVRAKLAVLINAA